MSDTDESEVEHISIMEYTEAAADHGRTPGDRVIVGGYRRNTNVRDDEKRGFVEIAKAVAVIELHQPIHEDDVTDWCNSQAGKLALSPWVGNYEPEEVIDTGTASKKRAMTDGGVDQSEAAIQHCPPELSIEDVPEQHREFVREKVVETVGEHFLPLDPDLTVEEIYVFGSFRRGEARRVFSDLDIQVVVKGPMHPDQKKWMENTIKTQVTRQLPGDRLFGYVDPKVFPSDHSHAGDSEVVL